MTKKEVEQIMRHIADCNDYLEGRVHSKHIGEIATHAARMVVEQRKQSLYDRLREGGLRLCEEEV